MATEMLNCFGMKCPQPVLKMAIVSRKLAPGTVLEISADCPEFPVDIKKWCEKQGKVLIACNALGGGQFKAQVQF
ncbi:MAG: sulfurtransferase TusA family protein [Candidatus Eisenbacteria bacterium]|uniref:Sulfurtransferase TusA family protein n=1 Tax=Eiseniibacteriota bacterium TaxID=2212470 RepID=A0A948W5A7_UNCEI|nr:sulfurtransferase TusA family protein [Candidatus Eisenbacteria bacterium]MBU1948188.1 sulfurtransferase TusA family protein [Candidatus Eisenbacteria bacterium]MBU2689815.1 sulfurtransferase TusA family protein [Candidatus Eisenbacteria bacterium]